MSSGWQYKTGISLPLACDRMNPPALGNLGQTGGILFACDDDAHVLEQDGTWRAVGAADTNNQNGKSVRWGWEFCGKSV